MFANACSPCTRSASPPLRALLAQHVEAHVAIPYHDLDLLLVHRRKEGPVAVGIVQLNRVVRDFIIYDNGKVAIERLELFQCKVVEQTRVIELAEVHDNVILTGHVWAVGCEVRMLHRERAHVTAKH